MTDRRSPLEEDIAEEDHNRDKIAHDYRERFGETLDTLARLGD